MWNEIRVEPSESESRTICASQAIPDAPVGCDGGDRCKLNDVDDDREVLVELQNRGYYGA